MIYCQEDQCFVLQNKLSQWSSVNKRNVFENNARTKTMTLLFTPYLSRGKAMTTLFSSWFTWFKVKVPVLSLQIVVAEPIVSQAESRRTCNSTSIKPQCVKVRKGTNNKIEQHIPKPYPSSFFSSSRQDCHTKNRNVYFKYKRFNHKPAYERSHTICHIMVKLGINLLQKVVI